MLSNPGGDLPPDDFRRINTSAIINYFHLSFAVHFPLPVHNRIAWVKQAAENPSGAAVLKEHDFSRADMGNEMRWASAPEGMSLWILQQMPSSSAA